MDQCQYSEITSTTENAGITGEVMVILQPPENPAASSSTRTDAESGNETEKGTNMSKGKAVAKEDAADRSSTPVLNMVKAKLLKRCEIPNCGKKSDRLTFATTSVLTYFGYKNRFAVVKVCPDCKCKADTFEKKSVVALRKFESIFLSTKHEPQIIPEVVSVDSDDDDASHHSHHQSSSTRLGNKRAEDEVMVDFNRWDVEGLVKGVMDKFKILTQMEQCKADALTEATELGEQMAKLQNDVNRTDDQLHDICQRYKGFFEIKQKPMVIQEVEINADGATRRKTVGKSNMFVNTSVISKLATGTVRPLPLGESLFQNINDPSAEADRKPKLEPTSGFSTDMCHEAVNGTRTLEEIRKPGPASKTHYYDCLDSRLQLFQAKVRRPSELQVKRRLFPTPLYLPRLKPKIGDIVYALHFNGLSFWLQGEVLDTFQNATSNQLEYIIHFEPTLNGKPTYGVMVDGDGSVRKTRQLTLREIAYNLPCPYVLPVGTRIIAKYVDEIRRDPQTDGYFYAGIVAEPPRPSTKDRYLIFFDDGGAQYVNDDDVLLVCEASKQVWKDVHPGCYSLVKEYVTAYPVWPMLKLKEGSIVTTEWNDKFLPSRVLELDCSLAKVRCEADKHAEWIYRGSARFKQIYNKQFRDKACSSDTNKIPRHDKTPVKIENFIEYNIEREPGHTSSPGKAKKSTGAPQAKDELTQIRKYHFSVTDPDLSVEFQGKIFKTEIPSDCPKPKDFVPHDCNARCVYEYVETSEMRKKSPLVRPLLLGWERIVIKTTQHGVHYTTPCGIKVEDFSDLNKYLDDTGSNIPIDFFCFDYAVDVLSEFKPVRELHSVEDISYGKEGAPVECINSLDYDTLPFMEYTPRRQVGCGVTINTQKEFLLCCDCTDNCQDKLKCACWKLTHEGVTFTALNKLAGVPYKGYDNRRLYDHIVSGIYECNSQCKCKETCSNRVAQNGVIWPLQIFKTVKKGWGIRAIHDMPEGTFICVYSGQILTEESANEDGMEFGDEYLAELDYIECNEVVKQNYESDVTDIEAEDSDGETDQPKKKSRLAQSEHENQQSADQGSSASHKDDASSIVSKSCGTDATGRKIVARKTDGQRQHNFVSSSVGVDGIEMITARQHQSSKRRSTRKYFGPNESIYIMDAKSKGNIGRYLNHSCTPNVIVQNVFVDTHDLRFPLVAFFTNTFVKAGTELTWDYNYLVGSIQGRSMNCYCLSPYCRGRLL